MGTGARGPSELRMLTIVDEKPPEVSITEVDLGDVTKARDWAITERGEGSEPARAFRSLYAYLNDAWEREREGHQNFSPLKSV